MNGQLGLFPESATVVNEAKRKRTPEPKTETEWRRLPKIKGLRALCSQCVLERWRRERQVVNRVTYKRIDPKGEALEFCSEHAERAKAHGP